MLLMSPPYVAVISAEAVAVYEMPHEPEMRVQGFAENMPDLSVVCHETTPVGEWPPCTVALQVAC